MPERIITKEEAPTCGDGGCVFRLPGATGQHTNAGCRCLPLRMTPDDRVVVRQRIRGLAEKVARLERILAVERGEEGQVPEGWETGVAWCWWRGVDDGVQDFRDVERVCRGRYRWSYWDAGKCRADGEAPTALEAMEAADAALEAIDRGE